ncbi:HAMP domain-containing methyl-accepting chemotaxis protein [Psychromonas aquimarina]|uniref:HAMP domain-containing methyl-accepting chemotaxis protein n=1 Tax=Psychromonas aquimarina TaxID=444919 RepID=UPI00048A8F75|nr:methyl-accepting chemotaxis protein [Psychromonas aquimarina]
MKLTIGKKLSLSFGTILLLMTVSAMITYSLILENEKIQNKVLTDRMQTVLLGKDVINGVNKSLAALRGYMILGENPKKAELMKSQRTQAWLNIDQAIKQYDILSKNWTVPANIQRLSTIKSELSTFKNAQQKIEDIAHTSDNIPSYHLLLTKAAPKASLMLQHITAIINEEAALTASPERKTLLKNLADIRGSFAIGIANIRAYLLSGNDDFKDEFNRKWQTNEQRVTTVNSSMQYLFNTTQLTHWQSFIKTREEFKNLPLQMFDLRSADDWNKANAWLGTKAAPKAANILDLLAEMKVSQEQLLAEDSAEATAVIQLLKTTLIVVTLISLLVGTACTILFSQSILKRLSSILTRSKSIADGDMTGEKLVPKGNDELTDLTVAVNQMSQSLQVLVRQTAESMHDASKGTKDIWTANQEMATEINGQSAQVQQIASAIEELSNSANEVSNNCTSASEGACDALTLAKSGGEIINSSSSHMQSIKSAFDSSSDAVTSLNQQSNVIGNILTVIKGIADQTNLLALNAAIEAARAGEQGRGFAVVADEVRQLAANTTDATVEVETAISTMCSETENAVLLMTEGADMVQQGVDMSDQAACSITEIITSVSEVVSQIQAIAATAEEQTMVTAEIAQNTEKVSFVTQQVKAGVDNVVFLSDTVTQNTTNRADKLIKMI